VNENSNLEKYNYLENIQIIILCLQKSVKLITKLQKMEITNKG